MLCRIKKFNSTNGSTRNKTVPKVFIDSVRPYASVYCWTGIDWKHILIFSAVLWLINRSLLHVLGKVWYRLPGDQGSSEASTPLGNNTVPTKQLICIFNLIGSSGFLFRENWLPWRRLLFAFENWEIVLLSQNSGTWSISIIRSSSLVQSEKLK